MEMDYKEDDDLKGDPSNPCTKSCVHPQTAHMWNRSQSTKQKVLEFNYGMDIICISEWSLSKM